MVVFWLRGHLRHGDGNRTLVSTLAKIREFGPSQLKQPDWVKRLRAWRMPSRGVCSQCRKEGEVFTCSACGDVHYCSRGCQKAGWVSGHKFDCGQSRAPQPTHAAAAAAAAAPSGAAAHRAPQSAAPLVTEGLKAALLESLERSPVTFVVGRTGSGECSPSLVRAPRMVTSCRVAASVC